MLLNVTKKHTKSEIEPTLQARVAKDLYDQFTKLAEQYDCSNAELMRALIRDTLKKHKELV